MSISERAIAMREAKHRARRQQKDKTPPRDADRDPWYRCEPGTFGRPGNTEQREPREGFLERAAEALSFSRPDTRMASIAATFSKLMRF